MTEPTPGSTQPRRSPASYWDYIRVPELLALQGGLEDDESRIGTDEVVFITVHQVYELWMKIVLRDLAEARDLFAQPHVPDDAMAGACRVLGRVRTVLELAIEHMRLMETLTTRDYLEFRDKLFPANGGQSSQFREIEILLGLEERERIPYVGGQSFRDLLSESDGAASWALQRVEERLADRPTVKEALYEWLHRTPINASCPGDPGDEEIVGSFIESYLASQDRAQRELLEHLGSFTPAAEVQGLEARYQQQADAASSFLRAQDVPEAQRSRRARIRAAALFIETYRELPLLAWPREVLDGIVDLEQSFIRFRQRHARMAERMIGRRVGTGGSSGVDYLDEVALRYRVFDDLWAVRTLLVKRELVADPLDPGFYGFRFES